MDHIESSKYPLLRALVDAMLDVWPRHEDFLSKSFPACDEENLGHAEQVAAILERLIDGNPRAILEDYRWTCEMLLEEELKFRRSGAYRLKTFAQAKHEVYDNPAFMGRYMNGLLLSSLFWSNHRQMLRAFSGRFLALHRSGFRHLEVGPGHGLLLYLAARHPACARAVGWDVSATSVASTRDALDRLGAPPGARVEQHDVLNPPQDAGPFDSVVISEVLEHLVEPRAALRNLRRVMAPGGRIFVNMPVNSPAPDHIYLLESPEQVTDLVAGSGFRVIEIHAFPATGYTEARARKLGATLSCVVIATPEP